MCEFVSFFFRLCYVQTLAGHKSPVTAVSASETSGDIATVCDSGELPPARAAHFLARASLSSLQCKHFGRSMGVY